MRKAIRWNDERRGEKGNMMEVVYYPMSMLHILTERVSLVVVIYQHYQITE